MIVHQDFSIRGTEEELENFDKAILETSSGWKRDLELEKRLSDPGTQYISIATPHLAVTKQGAILHFVKYPSERRLINILPVGKSGLSISEYNSIIQDFTESLNTPEINTLNLTFDTSKEEMTIDDIFGEEVANKLRRFSSAANKNTGSSHPLDKQRWNDFILKAADANSSYNIDLLKQWLIEDGWDEVTADELVMEFETGAILIRQYAGV